MKTCLNISNQVIRMLFKFRIISVVAILHFFVVGTLDAQVDEIYSNGDINSFSITASISYGQNLNEGTTRINMDEHTTWTINKGKSKIKNGKGFDLLNYKFEKPGDYTLNLLTPIAEDSDVCEHVASNGVVLLRVSNAQVEFLVDEMTFNKKLLAGMDLADVYIEVPIDINYFKENKEELDFNRYHIAGSTQLYLRLQAPEIQGAGKYILRYYLTGSITHKGYYAITFFNVNNKDFSVPFEVF